LRSAWPPGRALVFDFDGMILDTETPLYESWAMTYEQHGCRPPTIEEWARQLGGTDRGSTPLAGLMDGVGTTIDTGKVLRARRAYGQRLLAREPVRPGVAEWLTEAKARGLPLGVASSSSLLYVVRHLRRIDVYRHFDAVACPEGDVAPKPAPDLYVKACAALAVRPAEALAVEDSPVGIAAAKAAGLYCVATPNRVTSSLDLSQADLIVDSLSDTTLSDVLASMR
jgi:HAD superfamily hydrolase (TIGR01509 family)